MTHFEAIITLREILDEMCKTEIFDFAYFVDGENRLGIKLSDSKSSMIAKIMHIRNTHN